MWMDVKVWLESVVGNGKHLEGFGEHRHLPSHRHFLFGSETGKSTFSCQSSWQCQKTGKCGRRLMDRESRCCEKDGLVVAIFAICDIYTLANQSPLMNHESERPALLTVACRVQNHINTNADVSTTSQLGVIDAMPAARHFQRYSLPIT